MDQRIPSVTDLVSQIKRNLEGSFRNVMVVGEVTNLSSSASGHWYFSVSDSDSLLNSALFRMDAARNPIIKNLKNGDKVICSGSISVYAKRGSFQLIVKRLTPVGKGDLKEQFEKLKEKLRKDGLFDIDHKVQIPSLPRRVAVVTAEGGAALQDFLNIIKRRSKSLDVILSPALVQGESAPLSIRKALERVIRYNLQLEDDNQKIDVIVLTRGGGSLEDLWAFNDEALAWDIFNCPIPIISAVGHQVDFSISDFVADLRMETPSAAAETLTNTSKQLNDRMENIRSSLLKVSKAIIQKNQLQLERKKPSHILETMRSMIYSYQNRLKDLHLLSRRYELVSYSQYNYELDNLVSRLKSASFKFTDKSKNRLDELMKVLNALDPNQVLTRGYAYTEVDGHVISSFADFKKIEKNTLVKIHFADGVGNLQKVSEGE